MLHSSDNEKVMLPMKPRTDLQQIWLVLGIDNPMADEIRHPSHKRTSGSRRKYYADAY